MFRKCLILILVTLIGILVLDNIPNFALNLTEAGQPLTKILPSPNLSIKKIPRCLDHNSGSWHPAAKKDLNGNIDCVYGHEHGDPIPSWLTSAGFQLGFDNSSGFIGNTSAYENSTKHAGMKGFAANIKGTEVYARVHLASNVLDRSSRYHSYELFLKDHAGNISHFQGWLDTGDPLKDRIPYRDSTAGEQGKDPGKRPIVWASTKQACKIDQTWCIELWAMKTWDWGPDLVWGINDATTFYNPGEENTEDISKWITSGSLGTNRSLTVTVYRNPQDLKKRGVGIIPVGEIWATQFGEIVTSSTDQRCNQSTLKFGQIYKNICLKNYIAPTLEQITGVGNTAQKDFDSIGVEVPN